MLAPIGATSCTSTCVPSLLVISKPDAFGSTGPLNMTCIMGRGPGMRALATGSVTVAASGGVAAGAIAPADAAKPKQTNVIPNVIRFDVLIDGTSHRPRHEANSLASVKRRYG